MATITSDAFAKLLDARYKRIILSMFQAQPVAEQIFNVLTSQDSAERTALFAAGGYLAEKTKGGPQQILSAYEDYAKTYTHATYAGYFEIEQEVFEDDHTGSLAKLPNALAAASMNTAEYLAFEVLNDGFTVAGPDGSYLWATDHIKLSGGTWSNRPASEADLSPASFRDALSALYQQPDPYGVPRQLMPAILLVHPDQYYYAREIIGSAKLADTANNNINAWQGIVTVLQSAHWTDTDAWALFSAPQFHDLNRYWRIKPEIRNLAAEDRDFQTGDLRMKVRLRISHGYGAPFGTYATSGAA